MRCQGEWRYLHATFLPTFVITNTYYMNRDYLQDVLIDTLPFNE